MGNRGIILLWRLWYRLCDYMRPDDAWERDVALANRWARGWIVGKIVIMSILYWIVFDLSIEIEERWAIEEALKDWEMRH